MSKMSKKVKEQKKEEKFLEKNPVVNFMGGISYELNPLDKLKMISASSVFGEPQYYRNGVYDKAYICNDLVAPYEVFNLPRENTSDIMVKAINEALDYDFEATIKWASTLRNDFYMRLNPQVIMVLAAIHPKRAEFNKENPNMFRACNSMVMRRADEPAMQLSFYLYNNGSKNNIPSILKRSWANRIENMKPYEMAKYKNHEVGLIDTIRVCHAKGKLVDELMSTGTIQVDDDQKTWENMRSAGATWREIVDADVMGHMAILRNLRNIFGEVDDTETRDKVLTKLKNDVLKGKQFPFRYYSAIKVINHADIFFKSQVIDSLEECIDISIKNMPKLKGKTMCLSDNSGSAWDTFNSEYGKMTIAEIDNLSSVVTGMCSDEGYVGEFGDKLKTIPVSKRNGALIQSKLISADEGDDVGCCTENGIWLFFKQAIEKKEHWDNIFIYSDQQAGHGGLYGIGRDYLIGDESFKTDCWGNYIDVMKLIDKYRKTVNPKVNVFCVQTAGYSNALIPEYIYRGAVLYGWTGKESLFASEIIKRWDEIESRQENKNK